MALFENYEGRMPQLQPVLDKYGFKSFEDVKAMHRHCTDDRVAKVFVERAGERRYLLRMVPDRLSASVSPVAYEPGDPQHPFPVRRRRGHPPYRGAGQGAPE